MSVDYLGRLVGSWRLDSLSAIFTDNGERVKTFGPNPSGRMVLTPGGRIAFLITRSNRQTPIDDTQRAAQFNSMASYSGVVRSDSPGQFITTVDVSLVPSEIGGKSSGCSRSMKPISQSGFRRRSTDSAKGARACRN
jgi:hypothetical protein